MNKGRADTLVMSMEAMKRMKRRRAALVM